MSREKTLLVALISRRWRWVSLLVLALMILLARLGFWQLDRRIERREANAALVAALNAQPVLLNNVVNELAGYQSDEVPIDLVNRSAIVSGKFDYEHQIAVRLQVWQGSTGYRLVTPLIIQPDEAGGQTTAVLIDRGWIPESVFHSGERFADSTEMVNNVEGYIVLTESLMRQASGPPEITDWGIEVYRVDLAAIQPVLPYRLLPIYLRENPQPGNENALPIRIPREVDLSEGPHLSYALQWFIFTIGLGLGYLLYVNRSLNRPESPDQEEE